jgi:hypothetical protein
MRFNEKFSLKLSLSFNSFLQNYMFDLIIGVYYLKYSFFVKRIFLTLYNSFLLNQLVTLEKNAV